MEFRMKANDIIMESTLNISSEEFKNNLKDDLVDLRLKLKNYETGNSSVASAPDTTKFRTIKSGEVKLVKNQPIYGCHAAYCV